MTALATTDPVLRDFAAEIGPDGPVAVEGARTRWDAGGLLDPAARVVSAPAGVVGYAPAEMTITVRAGTTVSELDSALAEAGQRCALPGRGGTVGGAIAVGENHRDVRGRGRLRDAVLQVRYVGANGELVTGGGPVVKNVTGFNLPRLLVGSLGTLGLLAELVLRTNPIPVESRWFLVKAAEPAALDEALFRPSAVLHDGAATWVHLEGQPEDNEAEAEVVAALGDVTEVEGPPELPPHRWSVTPAEAASFDRSGGPAVASIGVGTVWASVPQQSRPVDAGAAAIAGRIKAHFDPAGRLNPGRRVAGVDQ